MGTDPSADPGPNTEGRIPTCLVIARLWLLFGVGIKGITPFPPTGGPRGTAPSTWSENMLRTGRQSTG